MEERADLLSTAEVADILGVSVPTITRWVRQGRLHVAGKLPGASGAYVFARADVEALRPRAEKEAASA